MRIVFGLAGDGNVGFGCLGEILFVATFIAVGRSIECVWRGCDIGDVGTFGGLLFVMLFGGTLDNAGGAEDGFGAFDNLAWHDAVFEIVAYLFLAMAVGLVFSVLFDKDGVINFIFNSNITWIYGAERGTALS